MNKYLLLTISILASLWMSCGSAGSGEGKIRIGVSMLSLQSEFVVNVKDAMEEAAKDKDVELLITDAQRTAEKQVQQVETFIAQQVDAIILNPCEVEASSPAVEKARKAGIPIINVNSETRSEPDGYVGSRDEESGEIAMEHIAKLLNFQGNIVMMHGYMGQAAQIKRAAGARTILSKYPDLQLLAEQTAEWDRAKGMTLMENWIQSYGNKIDAVFAHNDEMGMGALQALEQANLKNKVVVVSIDGIADAFRAVEQGRLDGTVFQDAKGQGSGAVEMALRFIYNRDSVEEKKIYIPYQLVTKENIGEFVKQ